MWLNIRMGSLGDTRKSILSKPKGGICILYKPADSAFWRYREVYQLIFLKKIYIYFTLSKPLNIFLGYVPISDL